MTTQATTATKKTMDLEEVEEEVLPNFVISSFLMKERDPPQGEVLLPTRASVPSLGGS